LELGDKTYTKEKKKIHFDRIQKNLDYMINMINEVLYVNRIDSNRIEVSLQKISLPGFCTEIFDEIKSLYPGINSTIRIDLKKDYFSIDVAIMKKILNNLILNAFKYNCDNGSVNFIINSEIDKLVFKIIDTGIGIPDNEQKNIFESFTRMTNVQHIKGTGLGLSIVKKSVEQLGGTIFFKSRIGEGTTFTVTIPIN
jgi:signal transduction histidine kinase